MYQVLIAEDEYIEREAMKHIIKREFQDEYEMIEAENGLEAVELAKSHNPDIIFLDIKMPGCSGLEAASRIRESLPNARIVFITAYDYFDYAKEAISLQVDEFMLKPVDIGEVKKYLTKAAAEIKKQESDKTENEEITVKFAMIKKQYQDEFMRLVNIRNSSEEIMNYYFEIMGIRMKHACVALIDFSMVGQMKSESVMQREFIKGRFLDKIKKQSERLDLVAMCGELSDQICCVWVTENEEDLVQKVRQVTNIALQTTGTKPIIRISEETSEIGKLPELLFDLKKAHSDKQGVEQKRYPFELEDRLLADIKKKEFESAKKQLELLVSYFEQMYIGNEFRREALGLYTVVKRMMERNMPELFMKDMEEMAEEMYSSLEMRAVFNNLFDYASQCNEKRPDRNLLLIQEVCRYLEKHYNEEISLEEAASVIGFSSFYFTKLMKEYLNMSYVDYITHLRIEKAKQLMQETTLSLKEIGQEVGYQNSNYFTRVFKRTEGITPSQYKQDFVKSTTNK
ncbi:MAG: response regulator [bacterium]|nr:response regulator [bacterium]